MRNSKICSKDAPSLVGGSDLTKQGWVKYMVSVGSRGFRGLTALFGPNLWGFLNPLVVWGSKPNSRPYTGDPSLILGPTLGAQGEENIAQGYFQEVFSWSLNPCQKYKNIFDIASFVYLYFRCILII